jgi:2-dehydro-3-deoxygalactonokinase
MTPDFIALDWGTTSFRAYSATSDGVVIDTVSSSDGILSVSDGNFDEILERNIGTWDRALPVLAAGMITSRQGWIELPYVACPAGPAELARALHTHISRRGRSVSFSTGLSYRSGDGIPDVMRSEETQVFGSMDGDSTSCFVTPGTHSKWIAVDGGGISSFTTYVTGEVFAALKSHTILGRMVKDGPENEEAFARGVRSALGDPAGFLHRIFSARSLALFGELAAEDISSYLSGQVIGSELAHALRTHDGASGYVVLASETIGQRYIKALEVAGRRARPGDRHAIVKGLARIGQAAGLLQ